MKCATEQASNYPLPGQPSAITPQLLVANILRLFATAVLLGLKSFQQVLAEMMPQCLYASILRIGLSNHR